MEILEAESPSHLLIDLVFEKPWKSHSVTAFVIDEAESGSTCRRTSRMPSTMGTMTGPMTLATRVMGIFKSMDSLLGPDFEKGLATLKSNLEA